MKLISFTRAGKPGFGAVVDGGIVDLTGKITPEVTDIRALLERDLMAETAAFLSGRKPGLGWADIQLLPVLPNPNKILCIGLNYLKHKQETGRPDVEHPTVFTRFADTQIAHGQPLVKPAISERFDYEGEMAIIIGKPARNVPEAEALDRLAGYSIYNDGSVRDWQRHTIQFTPGKNFPGTGAFGPYLVTADEIGDYRDLKIETRLNGEVMQKAALSDLLFPLETLVAYCSTFTPLSPGDVIVTGTPGGVGDKRNPPVYMFPGDVVEVEIDNLGVLRNPIVAEQAP
ncbi:fumarylacetoacetate hydrolase family protein [Pseudooceanicola sp.]|uniref:fumarylacetoacetate hydrolase family protein n=1 Tax=Pseudooceanicola sp. TaxID=1914328 RepID=UPI003514AC01